MGSVTVYSVERVNELIADGVIGATIIDGNIILQARDGSSIDIGSIEDHIPDASISGKGLVELATDTETIAGTDSIKAVTPFALSALTSTSTRKGLVELATSDEVSAGVDDTRAITPAGLMPLSTRVTALETIRVVRLTPASYLQTSLASQYPEGESILFLTGSEATTGGWSFGGKSGAVRSYRNGNNIYQTWQKVHTNTDKPEVWVRGGDNSSGWSAWEKIAFVNTLPTNEAATGAYVSGVLVAAGGGSTVSISFPTGRFSAAPVVTMSPTLSSRISLAPSPSSITTTGFTARYDNFTAASAAGADFNWIAMRKE